MCVSYDCSQWPVPGSVFSWMSSTQVDPPTQMTAQGGPPPCCLKVGQICPLSAHLNTLCFGSMAKSRDWPQEQICSEVCGSKSCFYPKIGEATSGRTTKNNKTSIVHLGQIWMSDRIGNGEISKCRQSKHSTDKKPTSCCRICETVEAICLHFSNHFFNDPSCYNCYTAPLLMSFSDVITNAISRVKETSRQVSTVNDKAAMVEKKASKS